MQLIEEDHFQKAADNPDGKEFLLYHRLFY